MESKIPAFILLYRSAGRNQTIQRTAGSRRCHWCAIRQGCEKYVFCLRKGPGLLIMTQEYAPSGIVLLLRNLLRNYPLDQITWARISVQYQAELLARARREGVPVHDAEDIVQEVLKAAVNYEGRAGAEIRTFLIAILQNQVRKWIRKTCAARGNVTVDRVANTLPDRTRDPSELAGEGETKQIILKSFLELPDYCRSVCELRHVYGYSYEDISRELEIPIETVKSRLHRARKILQERLRDIL